MEIIIDFKDIMCLIIIIMIFIIVLISGRKSDKNKWNNGECSRCKNKWEHFDTDSQGGRGYICNKCKDIIWISYNIDKERKK